MVYSQTASCKAYCNISRGEGNVYEVVMSCRNTVIAEYTEHIWGLFEGYALSQGVIFSLSVRRPGIIASLVHMGFSV